VQENKANSAISILLVLAVALFPPAAAAGHLEPFRSAAEPASNPGTPEKVELGKMLFFDRRLSGDGTMSCATCHIPDLGFGDGQAIGLNYPTTRNWRNTQTLINVAYQKFLFHDGRVESLEDQALFPIMSAFEMNQNLDYLEEEIRSVAEYRERFRKVFGSDDTSRERIAMAIAAFERTLVSRNAPLDRYLDGDDGALTPAAKRGLEVFTGKGKCVDCHYGTALIDNRFHALDVPEHPDFQEDARVAATRRFVAKVNHFEKFRTLEEDPGRYLITKRDEDWKAFRTPTLRDIANTGPYMHNGIFETLEETVEFHDRGGAKALEPLGLTAEEKADLVLFLEEALTGEKLSVRSPRIP
jgi:cytochrome c peroxidase